MPLHTHMHKYTCAYTRYQDAVHEQHLQSQLVAAKEKLVLDQVGCGHRPSTTTTTTTTTPVAAPAPSSPPPPS